MPPNVDEIIGIRTRRAKGQWPPQNFKVCFGPHYFNALVTEIVS